MNAVKDENAHKTLFPLKTRWISTEKPAEYTTATNA